MSPEQLKGGEVDTRSDVFSLGVVLYEIFTGFHPFLGGTQEETVNAILSQDPSPLICYIEHVPERLQSTLDKMLAKDPKRRYQSIHEVRTRLQHLLGVNQAVLGPRIAAIGITLLVLAIAAILVWQFILLPSIVVQPVEINSLAVLPLDDLMHDPEQEYFVEGMHEALITELSKIGALKVIARPSTVRYKGSDKTISEIAKELDVDALVGGSVLRSENQVRITAQVIQATTEQNLWVDSYDRELRDILSLHSEVAKAIAEQIHVALTPEEKERLSSRQAVQPEAYEAYLKGLHHLGRRLPNDFRVALRHFQKAREIDPNHALAYVGIADAYSFLSAFGEIPPSEGKKRTMEALTKALDIDNTLGEAHASLALEKLYNYDFIAAEEDFKKAIELNPNYAMAHNWYSVLLSLLGRNGEAIERSTRAKELDPLSSRIASSLAVSYYRARQYDRALEEMLKAVELDPGFWATHELMGNIYVAKGMYEDAIKAYETGLSLSGGRASDAGYAYAVAGESHKAREFIERFEKLSDARSIALVYVGLAENDLAFEWLEKAYHLQDRYLYQIASFPIWDPLRDDPRYEDFLRVRLRLPEDAIATHVAER
jgi:TolB-like protein/Flp pilus assembly protein TadD